MSKNGTALKTKKFLVLIFKKDVYHYNEKGLPTHTTTEKKFFPEAMRWVKATHADEAVAVLYQKAPQLFMDSDHYGAFSGWRAWIRFAAYNIKFYRYL